MRHIRKKEDFLPYTENKRTKKCKRCHGRGYEGQYIKIGSEDVRDKNKYQACICVVNADIKEQRKKTEERFRKEIEEKVKKTLTETNVN